MKKIFFALLSAVILFDCSGMEMIGAGATFPYVLYSKMFDEYRKVTGNMVNYQAIGSGGGIKSLLAQEVDFGATDAFLSDKDIKKSSNPILHVPTCVGSVVLTYNIPGNPDLRMTSGLIQAIFMGEIKKWDDARIKAVNPQAKLPSIPIITVHRSDGSGTTFIFTDYLNKVSEVWNKKIGNGKTVNWPNGIGQKGNSGVAGMIKQIPGSIGYVEYIYAVNNGMKVAAIRNRKGNFVYPSVESITLAAKTIIPDDTRASITDTETEWGYPIAGMTWLIVYKEQNYGNRDIEKSQNTIGLIKWMLGEGQRFAEPLHYAPLPDSIRLKALKNLELVEFSGKKI